MKTNRLTKFTAAVVFLAMFVVASPASGYYNAIGGDDLEGTNTLVVDIFSVFSKQGSTSQMDLSPLSFLGSGWAYSGGTKPVPSAPVPEPGTMLLLGISAAAGAGYFARRRRI